jgi:hypothetical protein
MRYFHNLQDKKIKHVFVDKFQEIWEHSKSQRVLIFEVAAYL